MIYDFKRRSLTAATVAAVLIMYSISFGFTCPGSEAANTNSSGNYVLGMPLGGIGSGNFNFLPDGKYNQTFIRVASDAGAAPLCVVYEKRGSTAFSANLQQSGSMTTTFTGYWPTVHMQYAQSGILDNVALECFSPICAGDNKNSSLPIALYIFTITNSGTAADTAAIALSNGANTTVIRDATGVTGIKSGSVCVMVDPEKSDAADTVTCGSTAGDFTADGLLNNGAAGILAKRVVVGPQSSVTVTFCVSWTNVSNGYYRNFFTDAQVLATYGRDNAAALKAKVDNWHNKILNSNLPDWLKDLTINCCHVYNSMTDWNMPNTYGMAESMSSGLYGTNDQAYHASFALPIFAPDAEWSQVTRMAGSQQASGLFMHFYDNSDGLRVDVGQKFILEVYRDYQWTGNTAQLNARYTNISNAISGIRSEDKNNDGLTDDSSMTTFDNPYWDGWTIPSKVYDNELYLGALKAAAMAASVHGSSADSTKFIGYFNTSSASFERPNSTVTGNGGFWDSTRTSQSGRKGYYTGSTNINAANGKAVWDGTFLGQWFADLCGLGSLHPEGRIESALNFINDACLNQSNPPSYALMMAYPDVNCTGATPSGTFFNGEGTPYCTYGSYPAGDLCTGFGHNCPDVSMRALQAFWNVTFSKYKRVYNVPCKVNTAGAGADWGIDRYMNPPAAFAALFGISGFSIDVNAKTIRLKPSLPTGTVYRMDSLIAAPLMNPLSLGTLDYRKDPATNGQRFFVKFDSAMQFNRLYVKKLGTQKVTVTKQGAGISATIGVNPADTSEYQIAFAGPLGIDNAGVIIIVGDYPVSASGRHTTPAVQKQVEFKAAVCNGTVSFSYFLPIPGKVNISLVNPLGKTIRVPVGADGETAGNHVVRHVLTNAPAGVYLTSLSTRDFCISRKILAIR
jgi:uncharacterized protein (DUF608 family)